MMIVLSKTNVHTILYSVPYLSIMFFQAYIKGNCGNIIVNPDNNYYWNNGEKSFFMDNCIISLF